MTVEMKKYKLGDLIDVSRGKSLAGEFYATSGNLVRLTMGNFDYINNCFKQNTSKDNLFFSGKVEEKFILNAGDIITPLTEQTPGLLGSTARIPESGKYIQSQDVALVRCKKDKLDDGFAYYLISSESVKKQLGAAAQQTKIRHTSPDKIKDCTVYIPEISTQKKIGSILSTLDQRIENLRAQNRVLEQTAKTIYDYTFLQCGNAEVVYDAALKRKVPIGWGVKKVSDFCNVVTGKQDANFATENGMYPFFTCSKEPLRCDRAVFSGDAVLISGNGDFNVKHYCGEFNAYQRTYVLIPSDKLYYGLVYFSAKAKISSFLQGANGSIVKFIHKSDVENIPLLIPHEKGILNTINNLLRKQLHNSKQIETLTTQRNTLLPLLMTGQIEV